MNNELVNAIKILNKHKHMDYSLWVMGTDLKDGRYCANGPISDKVVLTADEVIMVAQQYERKR